MSLQKQVIVELSEEKQREIRETFGEEFTEMTGHYDQAGRLIGEMVKGGAVGESVTLSGTVIGGTGTAEKMGVTVADGDDSKTQEDPTAEELHKK